MNKDINFTDLTDGGISEEYEGTDEECTWPEDTYVDREDDSEELQNCSMILSDDHYRTVLTENRPEDDLEVQLINDFIANTCGCHTNNGKPCSSAFVKTDFECFRDDFFELTREEKDIFVLSLLRSFVDTDDRNMAFEPKI